MGEELVDFHRAHFPGMAQVMKSNEATNPAFGKSAKKVEQALGKAGQFGALTFQDVGDVINLILCRKIMS